MSLYSLITRFIKDTFDEKQSSTIGYLIYYDI